MEIKRNIFGNYQCPCCGYFTLTDTPDNSFDICQVCYWEADGIQLHDPNYEVGANSVSLNMARENFKKFGAMEEAFISNVRPPLQQEISTYPWE